MNTPLTQEQKVVHLLNRTGFGPTRQEIQKINHMGMHAYLDEQLHPERISDASLEDKLAGLKTMRLTSRELTELYPPPKQAAQNPEMIRGQEMMQGPRVVIVELQQMRLLRAVYSQRQLHEAMAGFWSNHFNIFAAKGADRWLSTSYDRDTTRPHALGRFKDLLRATAQSPAMLFYLDNWLSASPNSLAARFAPNNRRRGLNENYARELMELHTLGVDGGYTQKDVQEVARCFTGWTIRKPNEEGIFFYNPAQHDNGPKEVLGVKIPAGGGIGDGERVLDILASHPSTAKFIATKLARRFVGDNPPSAVIARASKVFLQTGGSITATLRSIIEGPEFLSPQNYQTKVRTPFEYVAATLRATNANTDATRPILDWIGRMGQPVYGRITPDGYPDRADKWLSNND